MATLQRIRNRGVLLAVVIGVALLAFIVGDFLNSGTTLFQESRNNVGEINGEKVSIQGFQERVELLTNFYKIESGRTDFDEKTMAQMRSSVWQNLVQELTLEAEAKKMGLTISNEELTDRLIGNNIHPLIMQRKAFADQSGKFSKTTLLNFYNSIYNTEHQQQDEMADYKMYWKFLEINVKANMLQEKYMTLISKSINANNAEAKFDYETARNTSTVNYISQPYFSIPDSAVTISDTEIKKLYEKRKDLFKQEETRTINYVYFKVVPLQEDFEAAQKWMDKYENEFKTTGDIVGLVNSQSDIMYNENQPYSRQTVPVNLKEFAFGNSTGAFYGPVFANNTYTMAKIMQSGIMQSDSVKLRHIVIPAQDKAKADSLVNVLNKGANFGELAKKYSIVTQTAVNGGVIGWLSRSVLSREISTPAFSKDINGVFRIDNAQGTQIFQIMERTPKRPKVKLAILERKVTPSSQSYSKIYNDAVQFATAANNNQEDFDKAAKEQSYVVQTASHTDQNTEQLNNIPQTRQVVRWAFDTDKGDVSDVFDCGEAYLVATTTAIVPKGYTPLDEVKRQLRAELLRDKKAVLLTEKLNEELKKNASLTALSAQLNTEIKTAENINFSSYQFGEAGFEPALIGAASIMSPNKLSTPIKGNNAVYLINVTAQVPDTTAFNAKAIEANIDARTQYGLTNTIMSKLKDLYEVEDNRANFY